MTEPLASTSSHTLPSFSIEFLCKLIPQEFSGNRFDLGQFLANCNNAHQLASEVQKLPLLYFILSRITGRAKEQLAQQQFTNWDELKNKLKILYQDKKHYCQIMEELNNCFQKPNENINDFFQRLEILNSRALSAAQQYTNIPSHLPGKIQTINEITLNRFIYHSHSAISQMLRWKDFDNLNSAYSAALAEEKALNIQKTSKIKFCKICKRNNHDTFQCRSKPSVHKNVNINTPNQTKFCNYCKKNGHLIQDCRKREFVNNKKLQQSKNSVNLNSKESPVTNAAPVDQLSINGVRELRILISNDNLNYVEFTSLQSKSSDKILRLLIDTGASTSLIKACKLIPETRFNSNEKLTLHGLSPNNPVETIGSCKISLSVSGYHFDAKFHILNQASNVPFDGLLGKDVLQSQAAHINYETNLIRLKSIPHPISLHTENLNFNHTLISLKARSETIIEINVKNPEVKEGIIPQILLPKGIFISKCIVKVNPDNKAFASVLNTRIIDQCINPITVTLEPLPNESLVLNMNHNVKNYCTDREQLLKEKLRLEHLNPEEQKSILDLCIQYKDIFHLSEQDILTSTNSITHEIDITNPSPVYTKSYRYPEIHKKEVNRQIDKMLKQGIIQPSVSPWSSPLWVVPKKIDASGKRKWRIVIDYRKLNDVTVGAVFPLPRIEEILDQLGHSIYFTTLDLASGFHQIPMRKEDQQKTAFSTPLGHYEFTRMPFGLKNAPATFQRLMNSVLSGLQGLQCFVYLDDIVIYSSSIEQHSIKLRAIFERLMANNLKLQPDKCEFMRKEVSYLGHIISDSGVKPNPDKVKAINDLRAPVDQKSIKSFLGLVGYYRKFIPDFAKIAKPLTLLLKKDTPFVWSNIHQKSFNKFKEILTTEPLLKYPDFSKQFILTTDASNYAIGSVLSQGPIGSDPPIAFASRTLNNAEQNYSTTEKELLAIIWSVKHFRPYLFGRKFTIVTDHKPLTWLFNCKDPGSRLLRWRLKLSEYDYSIQYKPGKINSNADALSRPISINIVQKDDQFENFIQYHYKTKDIPQIPTIQSDNFSNFPNVLFYSKDLDENNPLSGTLQSLYDLSKIKEPETLNSFVILSNDSKITYLCICKQFHFDKIEYKDIFYSLRNLRTHLIQNNHDGNLYLHDITIKNKNIKKGMFCEIIHYIFKDTKITPTLLNKERICPNTKDEVQKILEENHNSKLAGHSGFLRTYKRIKEYYKWNTMKRDIKNYIKQCPSCQVNKVNFKPPKAPMELTSTSKQPFEKLAIDVVGPLPQTINNNRFILTMQDDLTKYSYAVPIPNHEAQTIGNELSKFFCMFGIPKRILSDQGAEFNSKLMKELTKLFQTKHCLSSPYHPQTNGALERSHLTLKDYLKHYINDNQTNWDEFIPFAMFAYNSHVHNSTKYTPYETLFGYKPFLPNSIIQEPKFNYSYDDYIINLQQKLNFSQKIARENLINSKIKSKKYYDTKINVHNYKLNDLVYILNKQTTPGLNKKLTPNYKGPYKITKIFHNKTVQIKMKRKLVTYHVNQLKPFVSGNQDD